MEERKYRYDKFIYQERMIKDIK